MFLSWKFELFVHISPSCQDCPSSPSCTGPGGTLATRVCIFGLLPLQYLPPTPSMACDGTVVTVVRLMSHVFQAILRLPSYPAILGEFLSFWSYPHLFLFGRWNMMEYDGISMISGGCQFSSCLRRWMVRDCTISSLGAARSQENMAHSAVPLQWHVHLPFGNHFSDLASSIRQTQELHGHSCQQSRESPICRGRLSQPMSCPKVPGTSWKIRWRGRTMLTSCGSVD